MIDTQPMAARTSRLWRTACPAASSEAAITPPPATISHAVKDTRLRVKQRFAPPVESPTVPAGGGRAPFPLPLPARARAGPCYRRADACGPAGERRLSTGISVVVITLNEERNIGACL